MMYASVYWNLHKACFSVRVKNRVAHHANHLLVSNASFIVQPAGRLRVLKTGQKNVHAFVRGDVTIVERSPRVPKAAFGVMYNPYKNEGFVRVLGGGEVGGAPHVFLRTEGGKPRIYAID